MRLATSCSSLSALLLAFSYATAPAAAAVSANDVTLSWLRGGPAPAPQIVTVSGTTSVTSVSFSGGGGCGADVADTGLLYCSISGNQVNIGAHEHLLPSSSSHTETISITTPSGNTSASVRVEITTGSGGSVTINPASLSLNVATGAGATSQTVSIQTLVPGQSVAVTGTTTSNGVGWLAASLAGPTTPTSMTVTVYPSLVGFGTYTGYISLSVGGQPVTYNVTMYVGTTGTGNLTFSKNPINFTYVAGGAVASEVVQVFAAGAATITGQPSAGCVLLDGGTGQVQKTTTPSGATHYANFLISFNPAAFSGTCSGTVSFIGSNGSSNTLSVSVNSSSTGLLSLSQTSLSFTYPSGVLQQQIVASSGSTTASAVYPTVISGGTWLSVTPTSGVVSFSAPATFTVNVAPAGLPVGTYTGQIQFSASGGINDTRYVSVSLLVGGGTGTGGSVNPQSLTYTAQAGSDLTPVAQSIYVQGVAGSAYTASFISNSGANWFVLVDTQGTVPGQVRSYVTPSALAVGTYTGTITISTTSGIFNVPVTLNVVSLPVIRANPATVLGTSPVGSSAPIVRNIDLSSSTPGTELAYSATTSASWIRVTPATGTTPNSNTMQVVLDPSTLSTGTYTGNVILSTPSAGNPTLNIPVVLVVGTGSSSGSVATPTSLNFTGSVGAASLPAQSVYVNTSASSIYTVATSNSWITVNPTSGYIPGNFTVSVNPAGLPAGTTSGSITVYAGALSQTIPVTVTLTGGGNVTVSPAQLSFNFQQGDATPPVQTVSVNSTAAGVPFTTSSSVSWLSVTPATGSTPSTLSVGVNPAGLSLGTHTGTITINPTGGSPVTVNVTLQVTTSARLTVSPNSLAFNYRTGTGAPAGQTVQVGSTGSVLGFTAATTDSWIRITPSTGTTPSTVNISVDPTALTPGSYTGAVTFSTTGAATASQQTVSVTLSLTGPLSTISRVSNAASYVGTAVSPGEIVFIEGAGLGPEQLVTASPSAGMYPTTLSNTRVLFNGVPGALIYTRTDQISAVVPFSVGARAEIGVQVEYLGQRSNVVTLPLVSAMPGIFTLNASGSGPGAILNQDYSVNGSGNGAAAGSVIAIYATGGGQTFPPSQDNAVATGAARTVLAVQALIGGRDAEVVYAGAAPQLINGALQVNARVPSGLSAGTYDLVIRINNVESRPVQVVVR